MSTPARRPNDAGLELEVECGSAGCATVAARGELDLFTGPVLTETLDELIGSGRTRITLDLTGLAFMDSSGHRSIGAMADLAESLGGAVSLGGCSPTVRRFLAITASILDVSPHACATTSPDVSQPARRPHRTVGF